jgi:hypothetical protein
MLCNLDCVFSHAVNRISAAVVISLGDNGKVIRLFYEHIYDVQCTMHMQIQGMTLWPTRVLEGKEKFLLYKKAVIRYEKYEGTREITWKGCLSWMGLKWIWESGTWFKST